MGRIVELIKNFIEPKKQQSFEELAMASGINESELKQLKKTMEGIDWNSFSKDDEENKKRTKISKTVKNMENTSVVIDKTAKKSNQEVENEIEK